MSDGALLLVLAWLVISALLSLQTRLRLREIRELRREVERQLAELGRDYRPW